MRQLVTPEQYSAHNHTADISQLTVEQIADILDIAQTVIYDNTCGRLECFDSLPEDVQSRVVKAIMAQADFIIANFGADVSSAVAQSASIGSFSYSLSENERDITPSTLNHIAKMYLQTTGLLYRGDIDAC